MPIKEYGMVRRRYQVVVRYPLSPSTGMPELFTGTEPTKCFADRGVWKG